MIDPDLAWAAFEARDRSHDGAFVGAVRTTGIYCQPSCPARHPKREHVEYFSTPAEALAAGIARACAAVPTKWVAIARRWPRRCD